MILPTPFNFNLPQTKIHTYLVEGGITGDYEFSYIKEPEMMVTHIKFPEIEVVFED